MSDTNVEDVKKQEFADDADTPKNHVDCDSPVEDLKDSDKNDENSMPSHQEEVICSFINTFSCWIQIMSFNSQKLEYNEIEE